MDFSVQLVKTQSIIQIQTVNDFVHELGLYIIYLALHNNKRPLLSHLSTVFSCREEVVWTDF